MAAGASGDEAMILDTDRLCSTSCDAIGDYARFLPECIAERSAREATALREQIAHDLAVDASEIPSRTELSRGIRTLRRYEEQGFVMDLKFRTTLSLALWKVFLRGLEKPVVYNYSTRTRVMDTLKCMLHRIFDDLYVPFWADSSHVTPEDSAELSRLRRVLDVKVVLRAIFEEIGTSFRHDAGVPCGKRRNIVVALSGLCASMRECLGPDVCGWLMAEVASRIDGTYCYSLLYARIVVMLARACFVPHFLLDGGIWTWWAALPEGLVPKYDLMWFAPLSHYAELRWAGGVARALEAGGSARSPEDCEASLRERLPWLWNKIFRTLCLPFASTAATLADKSKNDITVGLERYAIPDELDSVFMARYSMWRDVARFVVYSLEPSPPAGTAERPGAVGEGVLPVDASCTWTLLALLVHRARPLLTPSSAKGEWTWHCVTLIHYLIKSYFQRISRERLMNVVTPMSQRLTSQADDAFVQLMYPIVSNLVQLKSTYELMMSVDSLARLAQISAMYNSSSDDKMTLSGDPDPFAVDLKAMVFRASETLIDPTQSDRHVTLLQMCACAVSSLMVRWPSALGGLLPITLWGIDPSDAPKTFVSLSLLMTVFSKATCLDVNDWPEDAVAVGDPSLLKFGAWPVPIESGDENTESGAIVAEMLPGFAVDFVEKLFDYISRMADPSRGRASPPHSYDSAALALMHGSAVIIAAQVDLVTYRQIVELAETFLMTNLLPEKVKPMKIVVGGIVRANVAVALPMLMPRLLRKLLPHRGAGASSGPVALHEAGLSESEAVWFLNALTTVMRRAGAHLLAYREGLEAVILSALMDEREKIPRLGAKLLRRLLSSLLAPYVPADFSCCGDRELRAIVAAKGSSSCATMPPLRWWGPRTPWWATSGPKAHSVEWHMPSAPELEWARSLTLATAGLIFKLLRDVAPSALVANGFPAEPPTMSGVAPSHFLDEFRLPEKMKSSHGAVLALKLVRAVARGTEELWPDERSDEELEDAGLPTSLPQAGPDIARVFFDFFTSALGAMMKVLAAQEPGGASRGRASASRGVEEEETDEKEEKVIVVVDAVEVPRILSKVIHGIGEVLGCVWLQGSISILTPATGPGRGMDSLSWTCLMRSASLMDGLHVHSKWRDTARPWWVMCVVETLESRRMARCGGHRFAGKRRELIEDICRLTFAASFGAVRLKAEHILTRAVRYHISCRWPLLNDIILPALAAEVKATLECSSLEGDAAEREQQRLNDALSGLSASLGGSIQGLVSDAWRRGAGPAARIAVALCEAIYASTKVSSSSRIVVAGEKRCEVTAPTISRMIQAARYWADHREITCAELPSRNRSKSKGDDDDGGDDDDELLSDAQESGMKGQRLAIEAVRDMLAICNRPDCQWRTQVTATSCILAIRQSLGTLPPSGEETSSPERLVAWREVWTSWLLWLMQCSEPKAPPGMQQLAAHGLMLLIRQPWPLTMEDLVKANLAAPAFLDKLILSIPQLHHQDLINAGNGDTGADATQDAVTAITEPRIFRLWPQVWARKSSRGFSVRNALFWQTYVALLKRVAPSTLQALIRTGAETLAAKPLSEAEYHVGFCEYFAGTLRALRRPGELDCRRLAWEALYPRVVVEVQQSSQERLEDWCDAFRYAAQGSKRPLLRGPTALFGERKAVAEAPEETLAYLTPLLNFAVNDGGEPDQLRLDCAMAPIRYEDDSLTDSGKRQAVSSGADAMQTFRPPPREASSFYSFKRLRLLMALLVEPPAQQRIEFEEDFCAKLLGSLQPGIGHPYKQLREGVSQVFFLILRAAACGVGERRGGALGATASAVEQWLGDQAERLLPLLRKDNELALGGDGGADTGSNGDAKGHDKSAESRPVHVLEGSGLCYAILHTSLARLTMQILSKATPRCLEFFLAASAHGDHELRTLAAHCIYTCCVAHPLQSQAKPPSLDLARRLSSLARTRGELALPDKELEKAVGALRPTIMANFCFLACETVPDLECRVSLQDYRQIAEDLISHGRHEVRCVAKLLLTVFLGLDTEEQMLKQLRRYKTMASSSPSRGAGSETAQELSPQVLRGVIGLCCSLLSCADNGVPRWTGSAVEALSTSGRRSIGPLPQKEIQGAIQAFMRTQQVSHQTWKQCQLKLTRAQLELLSNNKGKLSYFS